MGPPDAGEARRLRATAASSSERISSNPKSDAGAYLEAEIEEARSAQPAPFPETLIGNNAEFYLRSRFLLRPTGGTAAIAPEALAEYLRCFADPATIHATCEDYRAGATIDLEHSSQDGAKKVMCPLLVLWGERGTVGRLYDVMKIWREHAVDVTGKALPGGHFLPEEVPDETLSALLSFLQA